MRLEVGKTYRARNGDAVKIVGASSHSRYPALGSDGSAYTLSGVFDLDGPSEYDLLEEVTESAVETSGPEKTSESIPRVVSFRDQLARDLFVAAMATPMKIDPAMAVVKVFELADSFVAEAKRRG